MRAKTIGSICFLIGFLYMVSFCFPEGQIH